MHIKDISGIILCGGKSKRYGSDKGLAFYHGKQLIQHAIEKLIPLCDEILISSNNNNYHHFGYPCIADDIKQAGPASGILSAMKKAKHENCLVLACDMPDVPSELFSFLLEEKKDSDIVVPVHDGLIEPLAALYLKSLSSKLEPILNKGIYKMTTILSHFKTCYCEVSSQEFYHKNIFRNINYMEDID